MVSDRGAKSWNFDEYDWIDQYDERMRRVERLRYDETLRRLPEFAGAEPSDQVLDVGTGTGNSAIPFLEHGCSVVGVDPSERMLEQARRKALRWGDRFTVRRVKEPFLHLPFEDGTFDIVVTAYAIHHLDDGTKRQAVREMKRVLEKAGRIAIADTMFRDEPPTGAAQEPRSRTTPGFSYRGQCPERAPPRTRVPPLPSRQRLTMQ